MSSIEYAQLQTTSRITVHLRDVRAHLRGFHDVIHPHRQAEDPQSIALRESGLALSRLLEREKNDEALLQEAAPIIEGIFRNTVRDAHEGSPLQEPVLFEGELRERWQVEFGQAVRPDWEVYPLGRDVVLWYQELLTFPSIGDELRALRAENPPLTEEKALQNPGDYSRLIKALRSKRQIEAARRQMPVIEEITAHQTRLIARLQEGERERTAADGRLREIQRMTVDLLRTGGELRDQRIAELTRETNDLRHGMAVLNADLQNTQSLLRETQDQLRNIPQGGGGGDSCTIS